MLGWESGVSDPVFPCPGTPSIALSGYSSSSSPLSRDPTLLLPLVPHSRASAHILS